MPRQIAAQVFSNGKADMTETRNCPECGALLPASGPKGLCSKCALDRALGMTHGNSLVQTLNPRPLLRQVRCRWDLPTTSRWAHSVSTNCSKRLHEAAWGLFTGPAKRASGAPSR